MDKSPPAAGCLVAGGSEAPGGYEQLRVVGPNLETGRTTDARTSMAMRYDPG